jgi:hypothetical protein
MNGFLSGSLVDGLKRVYPGPPQIVVDVSSRQLPISLKLSVNRIYTIIDADLYANYQDMMAAVTDSRAFIKVARNPDNKFDGMMQFCRYHY